MTELLQPILSVGIRHPNYVNGRVLAAEDLKDDQKAGRLRQALYGQAIGDGVVEGLVVTQPQANQPILRITPGLALNCRGQALSLSQPVDLHFAGQTEAQRTSAGLFAPCEPPQDGIFTNHGFYVLLMSPASGFEEQAPFLDSIGAGVTSTKCVSRYATAGVQFRVARLEINNLANVSATTRNEINQLMTRSDTASLSKLRNWAAHLFFGTEERAGFVRDPFNPTSRPTGYGALAIMRSLGSVTDCDMPLALVHWTASGVQFVDMWAVRRRLAFKIISGEWQLTLSDRWEAEIEALFLQFHDQVNSLIQSSLTSSAAASIRSIDFFRYLPAAGLLPVAKASIKGIDVTNFFQSLPHRQPEFIDGALIHSLLREAMNHDPIDLSKGEMLWLYKPWQNERAVTEGSVMQPSVVFASAYMPYKATSRFDVARWDYSNYARCENCEI